MPDEQLPAIRDGHEVVIVLNGGQVACLRDGKKVRTQPLAFSSLSLFDDESGVGLEWGGSRYFAERGRVERWLEVVREEPAGPKKQPWTSPSVGSSGVRNSYAADETKNLLMLVKATLMLMVLVGTVGVIVGVGLALHEEDAGGAFSSETEHPYVVAGLAAALGSLTYALFASCVLSYIAWRISRFDSAPVPSVNA